MYQGDTTCIREMPLVCSRTLTLTCFIPLFPRADASRATPLSPGHRVKNENKRSVIAQQVCDATWLLFSSPCPCSPWANVPFASSTTLIYPHPWLERNPDPDRWAGCRLYTPPVPDPDRWAGCRAAPQLHGVLQREQGVHLEPPGQAGGCHTSMPPYLPFTHRTNPVSTMTL